MLSQTWTSYCSSLIFGQCPLMSRQKIRWLPFPSLVQEFKVCWSLCFLDLCITILSLTCTCTYHKSNHAMLCFPIFRLHVSFSRFTDWLHLIRKLSMKKMNFFYWLCRLLLLSPRAPHGGSAATCLSCCLAALSTVTCCSAYCYLLLDGTWLLHLALLGYPTYHPMSLLLDYTELLLAASLLLHLVCSLTRFHFHWAALPTLHLNISPKGCFA